MTPLQGVDRRFKSGRAHHPSNQSLCFLSNYKPLSTEHGNFYLIFMGYAEHSKTLVDALGLENEPVGISLVKAGADTTSWCQEVEAPVRHCQSIMRARKGEAMVVPADKQMCGIGAAALGMVPLADNVKSGEFHSNMGLYGAPAAAANTIDVSPSLEAGSVAATVVAPLSMFQGLPDVIVVTGTPEQIYWLLPVADTYSEGGRSSLDMASVQAACADSTAKPYLTGSPNISLGCFGCRKSTDMAPEEMLLGIPSSSFPAVMDAMADLAEGPIPKSRVKV